MIRLSTPAFKIEGPFWLIGEAGYLDGMKAVLAHQEQDFAD